MKSFSESEKPRLKTKILKLLLVVEVALAALCVILMMAGSLTDNSGILFHLFTYIGVVWLF